MTAPAWVPLGPRSWGCRSWMRAAPAWRSGDAQCCGIRWQQPESARTSPSGMPFSGIAVSTGVKAGTGSWRQDDSVMRRASSGRRPVLAGDGDRVRQVVAVEQLVIRSGEVVLAVAPGGLGVGAVAGAARRGPGEGLQVAPVDGQRRAGVLELLRDAGLEQAVAGALQFRRRQPVRLVLAERGRHQAEGVLGLPVGQQVRAVPPVRQHAEAPLLAPGQADQRLVHPGQVRGAAVGEREHHAEQQGADGQLPCPGA